jgi:allantoin racemase
MAEQPKPIAVVLAQYPPDERRRREDAVLAAAPYGQPVEFLEIEGSVYKKGLTQYHRAVIAPLVADAALRAQHAGYSAVVPYGTLDLGIDEARHVADIPVLGPGRTSTHIAFTMGSRVTVLCYDQPHVVLFRKLLPSWGITEGITSIRPVDVPITEMASRIDDLRKRFVEQSQRAIEEEGAEIILPLGMTMVPVLMSAVSLADEIGVPVIDPIASTLAVAAFLGSGGYTNSRIAYPHVEP